MWFRVFTAAMEEEMEGKPARRGSLGLVPSDAPRGVGNMTHRLTGRPAVAGEIWPRHRLSPAGGQTAAATVAG